MKALKVVAVPIEINHLKKSIYKIQKKDNRLS